MKIQILSDLHMEFGAATVSPTSADVVVLAGDVHKRIHGVEWAKRTFPNQPVVYVAGNHEFYGGHWVRTLDKLRASAQGSNVHFLEDDEEVINGVRFLGSTLWTNFKLFGAENQMACMTLANQKMNDYRKIRAPTIGSGLGGDFAQLLPVQSVRRFDNSSKFLRSKLRERFDGATVVVTHHAPHPNSNPDEHQGDLLSAAYASDLSELFVHGPDLWIHGHIHRSFDYVIGQTRVLCNPKGYPGRSASSENALFDPALVLSLDPRLPLSI